MTNQLRLSPGGAPSGPSLPSCSNVEGVSTRRVDDLVLQRFGCEGISKSQVSRICAELDGVVASFLERPLDGSAYRYLWRRLTQRVREEGRIAQVSVVVPLPSTPTARRGAGQRRTSEDGAVWISPRAGGARSPAWKIRDQGLRPIATVFGGVLAALRTHFMESPERVPNDAADALVATTVPPSALRCTPSTPAWWSNWTSASPRPRRCSTRRRRRSWSSRPARSRTGSRSGRTTPQERT